MPRIYVDFSKLDNIGNRCKLLSAQIDIIQDDFQHTINSLDWDIRFKSNINSTATQLSKKLDQYSEILEVLQQFIEGAQSEYIKLDEYKKTPLSNIKVVPIIMHPILGPGGQYNRKNLISQIDWKEIISSFGDAGKLFGIVYSIFGAKNWIDWSNLGINVTKTITSIAKDFNHYNKIGRAIGTSNSDGYFWRNFFCFNNVGRASTASSASARFYNNLHNTTSPYKLNSIFDSFAGKKGAVSAVASWAGLALSGFSHAISNIKEQKESNGTMSTGRVIAETISETAIDTAISAIATPVVGAAIATVTGTVAAPAVVVITTGIALSAINAGVEAATGQSAVEWISDLILNNTIAMGDSIVGGTEAIGNWFAKLLLT